MASLMRSLPNRVQRTLIQPHRPSGTRPLSALARLTAPTHAAKPSSTPPSFAGFASAQFRSFASRSNSNSTNTSTNSTSPVLKQGKMVFEAWKKEGLEIRAAADMHVHLRDGEMMELVVPTIRRGGVNTVMVMPNLVPPITTVAAALDYKRRLQILEPKVEYIMSLYLHPSITPATIAQAAAAGITNVKSYPAGVTTNSSAGVVDYAAFYPVFSAMEAHNLILNLHGELPPNAAKSGGCCGGGAEEDITVMNAEAAFLPTLLDLHAKFPNLRIILEHCTTAAAITAVSACGPTVAATITAHHLYLTIDAVVGNAYNFCKPVAKLPSDRLALLRAAVSGNPKFFFGTDSAPHPKAAKEMKGSPAAGCFTQRYAVQLVMDALEGAVEKGYIAEEACTAGVLEDFLGNFGRKFYGVGDRVEERIVLRKRGETVRELETSDRVTLANFRAGAQTWSVDWV